MNIKLTHDEVIRACAEYVQKETKSIMTAEEIIASSQFIVFDDKDKLITYNAIEFECYK